MRIEGNKIILDEKEAEYLEQGDISLLDSLGLNDNKIKIVDGKIILPASNADNQIKITDDGIVFLKKGDIII